MNGHTRVKTLLSILLTFIVISYSHVVMAATLSVALANQNPIRPNSEIPLVVGGLSGDRDWIGIYHKGDSNDWGNVLSWAWVNKGESSLYHLDGIANPGEYEARLFFHNSYQTEASEAFNISLASIEASKDDYSPDESITVSLAGLSGDRDWVGIYHIGDSNDWENVRSWDWADSDTLTLDGISNAGLYEARLFFHDSYNMEAKVAFDIGLASSISISTSKSNYSPNEGITVSFAGLSGDRDWVGVYRKGDSNAWGNVLSWDWADSDTLTLDGVSDTGEYEARLFFHNSYQTEATVGFKVSGNDAEDYAEYGPYLSDRSDINQRISIYKPKKDGVVKQHSPVVIVSSGGFGGSGRSLENFINFIVSKGYFVIGVGTAPEREVEFNRILETLNNQGNLVDKSKIGLIGTSTGGGTVFYNLKKLKDVGYAENSFAISLDGWFALGLTPSEVRNLHTTTLLLQFGGADGLRDNGSEIVLQDPRILMSIYNMLPGNEKSLSYLNNNTHSYATGSMDGKEDMLNVVGAMLAYKFNNGGEAARDIALNNNKYDEIDAAKLEKGKYQYKCKIDDIAGQGYNYCEVKDPH